MNNFQEFRVCLFPCDFPESFQELMNHLKTLPNFIKFELKYARNRVFFKDSLDLPEAFLPTLAKIELFWLKMNEKTTKDFILIHKPKNDSIIKESTFLVWLISILEELLWKKPFFELVKL